MGGFYGSIQVHTEDTDQVIGVVDQIVRSMQIRALVGPSIKGWIGIYPENAGQDERIGAEIANQLDCDLIHMIVHDDDVFSYWLYRNRQLVDSFWSAPGYFGDENLEEEEAMKGDPEAFRPLIKNKVNRLAPVLSREKTGFAFASESLDQFAKILGIANAVTSYEYLKGGETEGVKGWRRFQELPADRIQNEAEQRRESKARLKSERQELTKQGILLSSFDRKSKSPYFCAIEQGFLTGWTDYRNEVEFEELRSPWKVSQPASLLPQSHLAGMASDRTGRRVAMTASDRVRIYDRFENEWKHVLDITESDHAISVAVSPDGTRVFHMSRTEIVATDIKTQQRLLSIPSQGSRQVACHPNNNWLAVAGMSLRFISLDAEPQVREMSVGGKSDAYAGFDFFTSQLANFDTEQYERTLREGMETALKQLSSMSKSSRAFLPDDYVEKMKQQMEDSIEQQKARIAELKSGNRPVQMSSNEIATTAGFSRSGEYFWCATNRGLRVYEWDRVDREPGADLSAPKWKFDVSNVHFIIEAINEAMIVFWGLMTPLYCMDLKSGEAREFIKFPGSYSIATAEFSLDGSVLAISASCSPATGDFVDHKNSKTVLDLWDFERLLKISEVG